jgi:hypothetical protein
MPTAYFERIQKQNYTIVCSVCAHLVPLVDSTAK